MTLQKKFKKISSDLNVHKNTNINNTALTSLAQGIERCSVD